MTANDYYPTGNVWCEQRLTFAYDLWMHGQVSGPVTVFNMDFDANSCHFSPSACYSRRITADLMCISVFQNSPSIPLATLVRIDLPSIYPRNRNRQNHIETNERTFMRIPHIYKVKINVDACFKGASNRRMLKHFYSINRYILQCKKYINCIFSH